MKNIIKQNDKLSEEITTIVIDPELEHDKIVSVRRKNDDFEFRIKWVGKNEAWEDAPDIKKKYPEMVIKYYESKIRFV